MKKKRLSGVCLGILGIVAPYTAFADFDFCSSGSSGGGSGQFQQQILRNAVVKVGEIPSDITGLSIKLNSNKDVDIQLIDGENGTEIVAWPNGILNDYGYQSTNYRGMSIAWSGYSGDGTGFGNEYIRIANQTTRKLLMKAYGYEAGFATVNYSWSGGGANCQVTETGGSSFQQQILYQNTIKVGDIPPGINNLYIKLKSTKDVDIQLYDQDGTKIVHWPDGILSDAFTQSTNYRGMNIEWSGYNGDGTVKGNEYIKITGKTTRTLTMKVYGYQAGYAYVEYSWGNEGNTGEQPFPETVIKSKTSSSKYATTDNAFKGDLNGQCTWYSYGRVIELADKGYFPAEVGQRMRNAFWGKYGRDAKNWPSFLGGNWTPTTAKALPMEKRKKGLLAVWVAGNHGHVGFVEEVSADKTQYRLSDFNRGDDLKYRDKWYKFEGTSDLLIGTYPRFYDLNNPN